MTGITTINLGGQTRTLSFKNNFILLLGVNMGVDPIDSPKKIEEYCIAGQVMRALTIITYCGIVADFERKFVFDHGITIGQVSEGCDDADQNEFTTVWDTFAEIMGIPKATEKQIKAYEDRLKKNYPKTRKSK
jgi:hypothetical protein